MRQRIYDETSGEILRDEEFKPNKKFKQSHFYLTFYNAVIKADINITGTMHAILGQMDTKNRICLDKSKLHNLQTIYRKKPNLVRVVVSQMCNRGMMQKTESGLYFANPYFFSKANVNQLKNIRLEYLEFLYFRKKQINTKEIKRIAVLEKQIKDILEKD